MQIVYEGCEKHWQLAIRYMIESIYEYSVHDSMLVGMVSSIY